MATAKKTAAGSAERFISVAARSGTFRRAGMEFGEEATVLSLAELDAEQYEALVAEPNLVVTETSGPAKA